MVDLNISISEPDPDTAIVTVSGTAPSAAPLELHDALHRAERLGKPGLVVDLSDLREANGEVLAALAACQHRCIDEGRWLLVVPPDATLAAFLENLL